MSEASAAMKPELRWLVMAVAVSVAATAAVRLWFHFSTSLVPGTDGAYYLIQGRALWETGQLAIPDLPLTFWLQVGVAKTLHAIANVAPDHALVLAVKLVDSLLPALLPVPLALIGWQWQRKGWSAVLAATAPAAIAALDAAVLATTGTFQKNSLALVFFASLLYSMQRFLSVPSWRGGIWTVVWGALLALTHIGVFGGALLFSVVFFVAAGFAARTLRRQLAWLALCFFVGTASAIVVSHRYDAGRVTRLALAIVAPDTFTKRDYHATRADLGLTADSPMNARGLAAEAHRAGLGTMARLKQEARHWGLLALSLVALGVMVVRRPALSYPEIAMVSSALLVTAILGAPFYRFEQASRLLLVAVVPGALCLMFVLGHIRSDWPRSIIAGLTLGVCLWPTINFIPQGALPAIPIETAEELRQLSTTISPGKQTLVVARRGLDFWAAWILRTNVALPAALEPADFQKYQRVFLLVERPRQRVITRLVGDPEHDKSIRDSHRDGTAAPPTVQPEFSYDARIVHSGARLQLVEARS